MRLQSVVFALFICLAYCADLLAQTVNPKVDSLEKILNSTPAPQKSAVLNQLSDLLRRDPRGMTYAQEALRYALEHNDKVNHALALKNIGIAQGYENQYDLALTTMLESLTLAVENDDYVLAGDNATNIGTIYYVILSKYNLALEYYLKALGYYEQAEDKKGVAAALSGLGIVYTNEKKYDKALETLNRSLNIYTSIDEVREIPKIKTNIGTAYKEKQVYDTALLFLNSAIEDFEATNNPRGKAHALFTVGDIHRIRKDFNKAIEDLSEALDLNTKSNHKNSMADCHLQLGLTYVDMNDAVNAEKHFNQTISIASEIHKRESLSSAYEQLSLIHSSRDNYAKAYNFLRLHKIYHDSIFSAEKSKQIEEMQARFETEKKEQEIVLLKQEKALNQTYLFIAIGLLLAIAIISVLIVSRQRMKLAVERDLAEKENQLNEERKTLLEAELRNKELSEQQLQDQLLFKNKELASYTLNMIQKNEVLENLKQSVEEIKNMPDIQVRQKLNGLVNMVNYSFHLDRDWENFKMHFEQVHQNFFKKLLEQYPELSANDLKLCSLIKLNLDNRGIAAILNISQESAKVARHRLRKKLDLPAEQTLLSYFNSID